MTFSRYSDEWAEEHDDQLERDWHEQQARDRELEQGPLPIRQEVDVKQRIEKQGDTLVLHRDFGDIGDSLILNPDTFESYTNAEGETVQASRVDGAFSLTTDGAPVEVEDGWVVLGDGGDVRAVSRGEFAPFLTDAEPGSDEQSRKLAQVDAAATTLGSSGTAETAEEKERRESGGNEEVGNPAAKAEAQADDGSELKGEELHDRARELDVEGRSQMTADELRDAVKKAEK